MKTTIPSSILLTSALAFAGVFHQAHASQLDTLLFETYDVGTNFGSSIGGSLNYYVTKTSQFSRLYDTHEYPEVSGNVTANFGYLQDTFSGLLYIGLPDSEGNWTYHGGYGSTQISFHDSITISDPARNGTNGYLRERYLLVGYVSAKKESPPGDEGGTSIGVDCSFNDGFVSSVQLYTTSALSPQSQKIHVTPADNTGDVDYIQVGFTFGVPFNISATLWLTHSGQGTAGTQTAQGQATLRYLGGTVVDENLNPVTGYTSTSDSGTDYTQEQGVAEAAPPKVQCPNPDATGLVALTAEGLGGTSALLQTSPDMMTWSDLETIDFTGFTQSIMYQGTPHEPSRFFHLKLP